VSLSMIVLRKRLPHVERSFKTPFYWLVGMVSIVGCIFIFSSLPVESEIFTLAWMALGLAFYFSYGRWNSRLRRAVSS
jgi:basic amino acid/polyamine antiporter, APA family